MATFGEELRRMRKAASLSQDALGRHLGVTGSAVGEWERDESAPTRDNLRAIEDALGVDRGTLAALLGEDGRTLADQLAELQAEVRRQGEQIAEILRRL